MQQLRFGVHEAVASFARRGTAASRPVRGAARRGRGRAFLRALASDATTQSPPPQSRSNGVAVKTPVSTDGFSADQKSFASVFSIRGYEVGPDRRATILTIANLLQETGANHCVGLWGMTEESFAVDPIMVERNLIWVLTRLQIQMHSYPCWGDEVEIESWLKAEGRAAVTREFLVRNKRTGDLLGMATSIWVCVSTKTKRIARIPDEVRKRSEPFSDPDRASAIPSDQTRLKIEEIDEAVALHGPVRFAGHMNVDMNNHINNVAYLTWALDLLPDEIFETYHLKQVEIDFKAECEPGDGIEGQLVEIEKPTFDYAKQFVHNLFVSEKELRLFNYYGRFKNLIPTSS